MRELIRKFRSFRSQFYRIPYCVPAWGWAEHWEILRCIITGHIIHGPDKKRLYEDFRQKTGMPYVFGFGSGREAILAALKAWGVSPGDRIILPSYCCETVAMPVQDCGAEPVFCDIGDDLNMDVEDAISLVDDRTRAILVPHLFGRPAAIDQVEAELIRLGKREHILVIDDAAQSFGATLNGRLLGTFGDVGIVSFGPGKTMTATGGGVLLTNSDHLAIRVDRVIASATGCDRKARQLFYWVLFRRWRKFTLPLYRFFHQFLAGGDKPPGITTLTNVDAALARCQFHKLDLFLGIRRTRCALLDQLITSVRPEGLEPRVTPMQASCVENACTKYVLLLSSTGRGPTLALQLDELWQTLGVEIQNLYQPIHLKADRWQPARRIEKTETSWHRVVQIPVEPSVPDSDWEKIAKGLQYILLKMQNQFTATPSGL